MKSPIVLCDPPKRRRTDCRVGLSAWTDKSMLEEGHFYPYRTMSAGRAARVCRREQPKIPALLGSLLD